MADAVYLLGAFTSFLCAILLFRGYAAGKRKLLLWSGLCFAGLGVSNTITFVDLILLPQVDLYSYRLATTAISIALLLYGLIWTSQ